MMTTIVPRANLGPNQWLTIPSIFLGWECVTVNDGLTRYVKTTSAGKYDYYRMQAFADGSGDIVDPARVSEVVIDYVDFYYVAAKIGAVVTTVLRISWPHPDMWLTNTLTVLFTEYRMSEGVIGDLMTNRPITINDIDTLYMFIYSSSVAKSSTALVTQVAADIYWHYTPPPPLTLAITLTTAHWE